MGTPVCGEHAKIKLGGHANRSRVTVEVDEELSKGRMNADKLDPSRSFF